MLRQQIELLQHKQNKQEKKLELKDSELLKLRSQVGGLEVQCLKIELAEVKVRLDERDKQLMEWKAVADKLMKSKATFEKWKQEMDVLSVRSSVDNSPQQTPVQSEYGHSDHEMEDQSSAQELFGLANLGLTCYAAAALQCIQVISVNIKGKLAVDKFQNAQSLRDFYEAKLNFPNIFSQHDSSEALLQFMEGCIDDQLTSVQIKQQRTTKCRQCMSITHNYGNENELLLLLPCSHSHFSDCLRTYLRKTPLVMDNQFACNSCGNKTDADTWFDIQHTNEIFTVQLNRFAHDGIYSKKKNDLIEMPLKFALNNQQYELFAFVMHLSQSTNNGHYIAYANQNGIWSEYNDDKVTTSVDIDRVQNKAYYYCYRRVIEDYAAHVAQIAQANVIEKQCVYCQKTIVGPATHHVHSVGQVQLAGAMIDHLRLCPIIVSSREKIRLALEKHSKEHPLLKFPSQDIRTFFLEASRTLTLSHEQVCSNMKLASKAARKVSTKVLRANNLSTQQQLEEEKLELEKLKAELAALACTWTYKWDPAFVQRTPYIIVDGEIAWAGYAPPAIEIITTAVCDREGNSIYGTNTTRSNLVDSVYGKKRTAQDRKLERQAKITSGIALTLVEQKAEEIDNICKLIEQNKQLLQQFQDWMMKYKVQKDLNDPNLKKFQWVGHIFCDGIIVPKLPIFKDNSSYQAFLEKHGKLEIQKISDSSTLDCLYVRLLDSANSFTQELIGGLNQINSELLAKMNEHLISLGLSPGQIADELKGCHIRQVDYTRDMKGAFYSFNMKEDFKTLTKLLGMRKATHDEYTSIDSCFQFLNYKKGQPKDLRMKFYNKIFHLIQSEQGKKKVSMNLKALLNCSAAFFRKIDECIVEGLSRCEFSQYFYSADDLSEKLKFYECTSNLDKALDALNKVPTVYNTIPPIQFLDDYFETFASNLFIFEKHQWAVVYGKNKGSSYMGIIGNPCKMGKAEFVSRYTHNIVVNIIDNTNESDLPKDVLVTAARTGPQVMQIPMQSLGFAHTSKNLFDLNETKLRLMLFKDQLTHIKIVDNQGNPFFKIVEKLTKKKTSRTPKLPFSEAKPRKRQRIAIFDEGFNVKQQIDSFQDELDNFGVIDQFETAPQQQQSATKKRREEKKTEKETQYWKKKGFYKRKQRWQCLSCKVKTTAKNEHRCIC